MVTSCNYSFNPPLSLFPWALSAMVGRGRPVYAGPVCPTVLWSVCVEEVLEQEEEGRGQGEEVGQEEEDGWERVG